MLSLRVSDLRPLSVRRRPRCRRSWWCSARRCSNSTTPAAWCSSRNPRVRVSVSCALGSRRAYHPCRYLPMGSSRMLMSAPPLLLIACRCQLTRCQIPAAVLRNCPACAACGVVTARLHVQCVISFSPGWSVMRLVAGGAQTGANIACAAPPSGGAKAPPKRKGSRALARKPRGRKPKRSALALVVATGPGSAGQVRSKERRWGSHLPSHNVWPNHGVLARQVGAGEPGPRYRGATLFCLPCALLRRHACPHSPASGLL